MMAQIPAAGVPPGRADPGGDASGPRLAAAPEPAARVPLAGPTATHGIGAEPMLSHQGEKGNCVRGRADFHPRKCSPQSITIRGPQCSWVVVPKMALLDEGLFGNIATCPRKWGYILAPGAKGAREPGAPGYRRQPRRQMNRVCSSGRRQRAMPA
jgi:hypothetical protein